MKMGRAARVHDRIRNEYDEPLERRLFAETAPEHSPISHPLTSSNISKPPKEPVHRLQGLSALDGGQPGRESELKNLEPRALGYKKVAQLVYEHQESGATGL